MNRKKGVRHSKLVTKVLKLYEKKDYHCIKNYFVYDKKVDFLAMKEGERVYVKAMVNIYKSIVRDIVKAVEGFDVSSDVRSVMFVVENSEKQIDLIKYVSRLKKGIKVEVTKMDMEKFEKIQLWSKIISKIDVMSKKENLSRNEFLDKVLNFYRNKKEG